MPAAFSTHPRAGQFRGPNIAERGLRRVLQSRFAKALVYPQSVDHYLSLVSPTLSIERIRAEVVEVIRETRDVVTLVLRPNHNFRGYKAGQYVAVTVEVDGAQHTRCFSLSSSPSREDGLVTLTVKARAEGGLVSPFFVEKAAKGLVLTLSEPMGDFVLPVEVPARLLFISGGSGITPGMSMLRTLLASGYTGEVVFMHFARTPADVIFGGELAEIARTRPNVRVVIETESERGSLPDLSEQGLAKVVTDFDNCDTWVCGPVPMMNAVKQAFRARGAAGRVRSEEFVVAMPTISVDGETGHITFARAKRITDGDHRTLLEQAESAGLRPKSGCRMGICQSCQCKKLSGITKDIRSGVLSTEDNDLIKLCISVPVGDVSIDL
jgi:ferredoxin-NADP reductase